MSSQSQAVKRVIKVISFTGEVSARFFKGMAVRMDISFHKYGRFRKNYDGVYTEEFLKDFKETIAPFVDKWKGKISQSTSANGNALIFALERILFYACGGKTKAGVVKRGNTEYLMDGGNGLGIEFACPQVPGAKFQPTDSGQSGGGFAGFSEREMEEWKRNGGDSE